MSLPVLYTVEEIAEHARCSRSTVYDAINRGVLRAVRIGAKQTIRVTETAVLEWLGEPTEADPTPPFGTARPVA